MTRRRIVAIYDKLIIHHGLVYGNPISENKPDYPVSRGKPPVHTRFEKGRSGNPRGPRPKNLPALLIEALDAPMTATIDGERREITKREAAVTQLLNKSAAADLRATKMLVDMLKDAEKRAGVAPPPEPALSPRPTRRSSRPSSPRCAILGGGASLAPSVGRGAIASRELPSSMRTT